VRGRPASYKNVISSGVIMVGSSDPMCLITPTTNGFGRDGHFRRAG
jgi:hypothetical protein